MSSKKGQSKKIDSARRTPSRRGLAGYSAPRRKTPDERIRIYTLRAQTRSAAKKTPESRHVFTLYRRRHRSHTAAKNAGRQASLRTLQHRHRSHAATENAGRQASLRTLQHRHRSRTAAENAGRQASLLYNTDTVHAPRRKTSDSGYNPTFCKYHPIQQKKRRTTAWPPLPPRNLRRPLITPKNTAVFIGFFFYTSPGYAAESPCFRHKHSLLPKYFFAACITMCFTIIDFPSCFFFAAAV